jgi:hypothetical protein
MTTKSLMLMLFALCTFGAFGCEDDPPASDATSGDETPAEEVGEEIEEAADDTGEAVDEAEDEVDQEM